jgi:hypothetical protein
MPAGYDISALRIPDRDGAIDRVGYNAGSVGRVNHKRHRTGMFPPRLNENVTTLCIPNLDGVMVGTWDYMVAIRR